jgi:hypothetical protein
MRTDVKAPNTPDASNTYDTREAWLRAAANKLRPYFESCGLMLPERIRYAIAFTSTGRRSKRVGECWAPATSDDASYEIFIRADIAEPVDVLGVLVKELVHTALPAGAGHGKLFRDAALKIGLQGPMRNAQPGVLLKARLVDLAATLGPLPHASLHIDQAPLTAVAVALDRPKKQRARMLKAVCGVDDCGFLVRVAAKPVMEIGPPHCPKHGAMTVEFSPEDDAAGHTVPGLAEAV